MESTASLQWRSQEDSRARDRTALMRQVKPTSTPNRCFGGGSWLVRKEHRGKHCVGKGQAGLAGYSWQPPPRLRARPGTIWTANSFCLSFVGGHGGRDGERSTAMTGDGGAACVGVVRWQGPPAAGTGLSPSLGSLACFSLQCSNDVYDGCKCNLTLLF